MKSATIRMSYIHTMDRYIVGCRRKHDSIVHVHNTHIIRTRWIGTSLDADALIQAHWIGTSLDANALIHAHWIGTSLDADASTSRSYTYTIRTHTSTLDRYIVGRRRTHSYNAAGGTHAHTHTQIHTHTHYMYCFHVVLRSLSVGILAQASQAHFLADRIVTFSPPWHRR